MTIKNGLTIDKDGTKFWYLNDQKHRENSPAIEWSDGSKSWYLNGKCHREDGPAIEREDGTKYWYLNGQLHREDGPAIVYADGKKYWCLHDVELDTDEVENFLTENNLNIPFDEETQMAFKLRFI